MNGLSYSCQLEHQCELRTPQTPRYLIINVIMPSTSPQFTKKKKKKKKEKKKKEEDPKFSIRRFISDIVAIKRTKRKWQVIKVHIVHNIGRKVEGERKEKRSIIAIPSFRVDPPQDSLGSVFLCCENCEKNGSRHPFPCFFF